MKLHTRTALFLALSVAVAPLAQAADNPYSFGGGNCPSQGAWTQQALQQTNVIKSAIRNLKDNPACKGIEKVLVDLKEAAEELKTPESEENQETRAESIPQETDVLKDAMMKDGASTEISTMLLNRTIEAASISSSVTPVGAAVVGASKITKGTGAGLTMLLKRLKGPTKKGLDLATKVMEVLPQYDECLIGNPAQGLAMLSGSVKIAAALSSSGEGVGDKLGNAIASLMNMLRERKFTLALRELDETEFWFSMSCLIESATKNYCDAQNAQELLKYSQTQYTASVSKNHEERKNPNYDNPLEGYYLLVRELPMISSWLQQVQFGVTPKLSTDATFKNNILSQVTDLTQTTNDLMGYYNEQMLFVRELTDVDAKRNQLVTMVDKMVSMMTSGTGAQFFITTKNANSLPFFLIGRNDIPPQCRRSETNFSAQDPIEWMKTSGQGGTFSSEFADPDKVAQTIEIRMKEVIDGASIKASAYFRSRLVVDMPNLVNKTLTSQYMTTRDAFQGVYNYLVRFENRLNTNSMDLILIPSVRETKLKIQKFLKSYDDLRALGEKMVKKADSDEKLLAGMNKAAEKVIDTVYNEFNVLSQKDAYLTNRLTTFIEKDFSMRVRGGLNMTPYQQELFIVSQKNMLDKLIEVHGMNPTRSVQDLAAAQMVNKRNIEAIEEVFSDSFYRMIANVKAVAEGKGEAGFQAQINRRLQKDKAALRKRMFYSTKIIDPAQWLGNYLASTLFGGMIMRNEKPDLYQAPKNPNHIMGKDDKYGSFAQMQAMFCAQTLSFERRGQFYDICKGTVLKSFYTDKPELNLEYSKFLPNSNFAVAQMKANSEKTARGICAMNDFSRRNLVQWLKDQDQARYSEMME